MLLRPPQLKDIVPEWDAAFVGEMDLQMLFNVILAANFMDVRSLLDVRAACPPLIADTALTARAPRAPPLAAGLRQGGKHDKGQDHAGDPRHLQHRVRPHARGGEGGEGGLEVG